MIQYEAENLDVAVIGAGHAGIEAALAAARLGLKTAVFTLSLDLVGNMPCNPAIGGTGKGHLVYEITALGGEMGYAADSVMLQSRMLNLSKGPAVHSLRMQSDRRAYQAYMKKALENTANLSLIQAEVVEITAKDGAVTGVTTAFGGHFAAKAVVVATGTSLGGRIIVGEHSYESGPDNTKASLSLAESLTSLGVPLRRFKTGTPARIHKDSINFDVLEEQKGDEPPAFFTVDGVRGEGGVSCHITYTNAETHRIIRENLGRSPLFGGRIHGVGPRYCPSIEDKVVRFADKDRHQIFIEPMGRDTKEMYLQGLSSSLPEEVQKALVHSIKGLENAVFMRTAYAIEYFCTDPTALLPTLEFKELRGLYGAGQFNGSSGYEEAAAQGLVAGVNAALKIKGLSPLVLSRAESYIGTLIDDLVTKGTSEPYRMMTSRSEYRLLLRQENAEERLTEKGHEIGLISGARYERFLADRAAVVAEIKRLKGETLAKTPSLDALLAEKGYEPTVGGIRKAELLLRSGIGLEEVYALEGGEHPLPERLKSRVETEIKYAGYIERQKREVERFASLEGKRLPEGIDYGAIKGIRTEAAQKLQKFRPQSIGQASRISGISPADISVLLVYLARGEGGEKP